MIKYKSKFVYLICITFFFSSFTYAQDGFTVKQKEIIEAMNGLSETTSPKGKGADAYGKFLANDFSRWTIGGQKISKKKEWIESVRSWFDDGWRVSNRAQQNLEINIHKNYAFTRRIVTETYLGPTGNTSKSTAALAEIWIQNNTNWLLLKVNVHPMKSN